MQYEKLASERQGKPSSAARGRVSAARVRQRERFRGMRMLTNADRTRPRCGASAR